MACAGSAKKPESGTEKAQANIAPTKQFLPIRQYDKEGNVLPFTATPNPYTEMKSKVAKDSVVQFIAARKAFKSKNFDEAKRLLTAITENDKNLAGPWVLLGKIAVLQGDTSLAKSHFSKAIDINRLNVNAYLPLAKIYREEGEFIAAQNMYAQALTLWRDFPEAHLNLAILYDIYLNDPLQAQQHMEAYSFLKGEEDKTVTEWLSEIQQRTGIESNLYIGSSNTSQNQQ